MGIIAFVYGLVSYLVGVASLAYGAGFIVNLAVPKTIDSGAAASLAEALAVNLALLGVFAVQHSVMAREGFKRRWTAIVPRSVERSTYVLFSGLALALLFWQWRPLPEVLWRIDSGAGKAAMYAVYALGWVILLSATFMINHFDLFGLRQVYLRLKSEPYVPVPFVKVALYKLVRHPIMLGILIAFWATPVMTVGHLLFSAASTAYVFIGIWLEERDLRRLHPESYEQYRRETPMIVPMPRRGAL
jgi:protein-S-isoprenylcysteine O-methyltransferase Ste14